MLGGLFQDLYSIADMTIAGHTLGDHALAAISATSAVIMMVSYYIVIHKLKKEYAGQTPSAC